MELNIIIKIDGREVANVKKELPEKVKSEGNASQYARFFDESSSTWSNNPEYNLMFIKQVQMMANAYLKTKGCLFLNEVYEMLGMAKSRIGQLVGWVYEENSPTGDNYVEIIFVEKKNVDSEVNGSSILLDFNVDGEILDRLS